MIKWTGQDAVVKANKKQIELTIQAQGAPAQKTTKGGGFLMKSMKSLVLALTVSLIQAFEGKALAQVRGDSGDWGMGPGMMGGWAMGWFGMIFMVAFWVLVIVGLVFLIRWLIQTTKGERDAGPSSSRAIDILKERYARGEISSEEFEKIKRDL